MKNAFEVVCVTAIVVALGSAASAVDIDTVLVDNAGNANDSTGYGAVSYDYRIGKYEVTAGQYAEFLNKVAGVDAYGLYNTNMLRAGYGGISRSGGGTTVNPYTYTVDPAFVNRPVNYVDWGDSVRFANWLTNGQPTGLLTGDPVQDAGLTEDGSYHLDGAMSDVELQAVIAPNATQRAEWAGGSKRYVLLTSEDEWYKAAYHKNDGVTGNYFAYPTSSNTVPGRDMDDASGNNANIDGDPRPIDSGKYTTLFGEFQNSASPYDTFDQGGNVWEWNEAVDRSYRGLRGGSFLDGGYYLPASYGDNLEPPTYENRHIGFRISEVPEPATLSLLALGGLAMLRNRRKK